MTRTVQAASPLTGPLQSLSDALGTAVAREMLRHRPHRTTGPQPSSPRATLDPELESAVRAIAAKVLNDSLNALSFEGRMALIARLASHSSTSEDKAALRASEPPPLLSTAEAAARLEVSRPYVAMLCDSGKLGKVIRTDGGHRRIPASAVEAHLAARANQYAGAPTPREAGMAAGLYAQPDTHYSLMAREPDAATTRDATATKQSARKTRK